MKRIVFLSAVIFLVLCISSCSKEERMKKIVKELLYEQLDDPKSYEAGSFTFKDERTYNIPDTLLTNDWRKDIEIAEQNIEYFKEKYQDELIFKEENQSNDWGSRYFCISNVFPCSSEVSIRRRSI